MYLSDNDAIYDVIMEEPVRRYHNYRPTQPFSFLDKLTDPIMQFVALDLLYVRL